MAEEKVVIHYEMVLGGECEDVLVTIQDKTFEGFEAWVEVRGVSKYAGVYKNSCRGDYKKLFADDIALCYKESKKLLDFD